METKKPTVFEWCLYAWMCLNVAIALWLSFGGATQVAIVGSVWTAWIPPLIAAVATTLLLWRLLTPTWVILGLATLFYLLQVVEVRLPDALYAFDLGQNQSARHRLGVVVRLGCILAV